MLNWTLNVFYYHMFYINNSSVVETYKRKSTHSGYLWSVSLACSYYLGLTVECVPIITCKMMLIAKKLVTVGDHGDETWKLWNIITFYILI